MKGIYAYYDTLNEEIVYVGKDSHIEQNRRHQQHYQTSNYNEQTINQVLQKNDGRYVYKPIYVCPPHLDDTDLNGLEMMYIEALNPKFNFTNGGDGFQSGKEHPYYGKSLSTEHKNKISETLKGRVFSDEHCRKLSERGKGKTKSDEIRKKISKNNARVWLGKSRPIETKLKMSKARNTSGYYNVSKHKNKGCKQGFLWEYNYYDGGKQRQITSVDLDILEQKVKAKGLEWYKLEEVKE